MSGQSRDPLNRFFNEVTARSGLFGIPQQRMSEKEALLCLGVIVETGKKKMCEIIGISWEKLAADIKVFFLVVSEETLFNDPTFAFSLRLAFCNTAGAALEVKEDANEAFGNRIAEVFPDHLCVPIYKYAFAAILKDLKAGKGIVPPEEEIAKHFEERRKAAKPFMTDARPSMQPNRHTGTNTWMEPCPDCGLEKRLDKRTKRFNCKQCGFDQPYPFKPAS